MPRGYSRSELRLRELQLHESVLFIGQCHASLQSDSFAYSYTRSRISHQQRVHSFQGASSLFAFRDPSDDRVKNLLKVCSRTKKRLCSLNKHTKMLHFANFVSFSSASDRPLLFTKTNSSAYCYYQSRASKSAESETSSADATKQNPRRKQSTCPEK